MVIALIEILMMVVLMQNGHANDNDNGYGNDHDSSYDND